MKKRATPAKLAPTYFWGRGPGWDNKEEDLDREFFDVRLAHMLLTANAAEGNRQGIRDFSVDAAWINQYNASGHTPLTACLDGAVPGTMWTVSLLLLMGCDPNLPNHTGRFPLEMAAEMKQRRAGLLCARRLVKGGANANGLNAQNQTALFFVSRPQLPTGNAGALVKFLIASGCDPNQRDVYNERALNSAVMNGRMDVIEALLDGGAIPDEGSYLCATPKVEALLRARQELHHLNAQVAPAGPRPRRRC